MLLFQAGITDPRWVRLGIGLCTILIAAARLRVPDYASVITFGNLALAFGMFSSSPRSQATSRFVACSDRALRHLSELTMNAIEARDLSKWFGEGETRTNAVQNVAFDAHFQEMLFIVGPSGSGKKPPCSACSREFFVPTKAPSRSRTRTFGAYLQTSSPTCDSTLSASSSKTSTCSANSRRSRM